DRIHSRFGRRRPIMVAGTLLTFPGLVILMFAGTYPLVLVGYAIIQFFFNAAGAAYAGIIPDVVPAQETGKASGFLATMTQLGITAVLYFLLNFFRDVVLGTSKGAEAFTSNWLLVVVATAIPFGFFGGLLSDRLRRRKVFVYTAGAAQALVAIIFIAFYPTATALVFGLGVAYGVGYGLYFAVDWALACDTLPDPKASAKDMGLFHIALTLPQAIIP